MNKWITAKQLKQGCKAPYGLMKQAAKTATGRGGRLDGSVKSRTAKRASNDVKRYHDKDYAEDWSKLGPWGEEYERLNRQPARSRFDILTDEENRSVIKPRRPLGPKAPRALVLYCTYYVWAHDDYLVRSQV